MATDLELATSDQLADEIERLARNLFDLIPILNEINRRHKTNTMLGARSRRTLAVLSGFEVEVDGLVLSLRRKLAIDELIDGRTDT